MFFTSLFRLSVMCDIRFCEWSDTSGRGIDMVMNSSSFMIAFL